MEIFCQILIVVNVLGNFFMCVYINFNGREARGPNGFPGFIGSFIVVGLALSVCWGAGLFSRLFN